LSAMETDSLQLRTPSMERGETLLHPEADPPNGNDPVPSDFGTDTRQGYSIPIGPGAAKL